MHKIAIVFQLAAAAGPNAAFVATFASARFVPLDTGDPASTEIAILRGDPATGPSDILARFPRGEGRMHVHSNDYRLVVLSGTMTHVFVGDRAKPAPLGPGSYWFQPGGQPHSDSCLSEQCTMFISWSGRRDSRRVEEE